MRRHDRPFLIDHAFDIAALLAEDRLCLRAGQGRGNHADGMQSADLEIDRPSRLVIFAPGFAEDKGEQHRENDAKLEEDGRADVMMLATQIDFDDTLNENGDKDGEERGEYNQAAGAIDLEVDRPS